LKKAKKKKQDVNKIIQVSNKKFKGGSKLIIQQHRHQGVFVARGKEDAICTKNMVFGESVYGEKRILIKEKDQKSEFRIWNPFRSKLSAAILGGIDDIYLKPGMKVLYLGAASGTTVSHISDIIGIDGTIYAVEFSHRSGRDLLNLAKKRQNIIPIIEDARHPQKYRMFLTMVDLIFSDIAQPDQARIMSINANHFLRSGGFFIITIKASCIDSTSEPSLIFSKEVQKLQKENFKPIEQITLEPYERDHAMVFGKFRTQKFSN